MPNRKKKEYDSREFRVSYEHLQLAIKRAHAPHEQSNELDRVSKLINLAINSSGYDAGIALCQLFARDRNTKADWYDLIDDPAQE